MNAIQNYLLQLNSLLKAGSRQRIEIVDEVRGHLEDSVSAGISHGKSELEAQKRALKTFGEAIVIARGFNAAIGAKAMRRSVFIDIASGLGVVGAFLFATTSYPRSTHSAAVASQVTFFAGVIAMQFAIVAGARGAARALSIWRNAASRGSDRKFVQRSLLVSSISLLVGALCMVANFAFAIHFSHRSSDPKIYLGALGMLVFAVYGIGRIKALPINSSDEDWKAEVFESPRLLSFGERIFQVIKRFPTASCALGTVGATTWVILHAETGSVTGSLPDVLSGAWPWGLAECLAVLSGFVFLGRTLELWGKSASTLRE